jgi:hypothetical protein
MCGNSAYCWKTVLTLRLYGGTRLTSIAVEHDLARGRLLEASDHLERRGLAAARRAEHREELATFDAEVGVLDGHEVTELLANVLELDDDVAHGRCGAP